VLVVVEGYRACDVGEMLWAPHSAKIHERVVGLPTCSKPPVPIVAPLATRLQRWWQPGAPTPLKAATIIVVAIEVSAVISRELRCASVCEEALPSAWDLQVEAVIPADVIANVRGLHHHALAHEVGMRAAPVAVLVLLVNELELKALSAIGVASEPISSTYCQC